MTDTQTPLRNTEHTLAIGPIISSDAPLTNGHLTPVDGLIDDDSTIKCICGFNDDDGLTVLCEDCNTWQHIECYYPGSSVPDIHQCVTCNPRHVDAKAATERQKQTRFSNVAGERKQKRAPTKSHKKKNRDSVSAIHINGNTHGDKLGHDRNSGSPLDIPPAKRPKTNHRTSSSTTALLQQTQTNPTRRRNNSVAAGRASPTKSPPNVNGFQRPNERFSTEFMQMYDKDYIETTTNSYNNLGTTVALSRWLDDSEEFEKIANGQTQHDVYMRWDSAWHVLEEMSPGVDLQRFEDTTVTAHGRHPVFHYLTAERDAGKGAFLGELTGQIAIKQDYENSSKMWSILKHPEPFVFFSDRLPICIDARKEGNKFRYIRRSCQPNSKMQIVIAGKEYRFCLVTESIILANDEITLPWYIDPRIMDILRASVDQKPISPEDHEYRVKWISGILAHFGRCACNRPDDQCLLSLARTPRFQTQDTNGQPTKTVRKKSRKHLTQISPSSTGHATNSRAGSEAVNQFDVDAEVAESPISGSGPSKTSSRDISPTVSGAEAGIGLGVDLSEREKRKIQEQERLFARLEQDGSRRRKRNSGGSTVNTPTVPHTVSDLQSHQSDWLTDRKQRPLNNPADAVSPSPTIATMAKPKSSGRPPIDLKSQTSTSKPVGALQREYSESSTQTEETPEDCKVDALLVRQRRALGCSYAQRLLIRSRSSKSRGGSKSSSPASEKQAGSPSASQQHISLSRLEIDSPSRQQQTNKMLPPPLPAHAVKENSPILAATTAEPKQMISEDVEMLDSTDADQESSAQTTFINNHTTKVQQALDSSTATTPGATPVINPNAEPQIQKVSEPAVRSSMDTYAVNPALVQPSARKPSLIVELPVYNMASTTIFTPPTTSKPSTSTSDVPHDQSSTTLGEPPDTPTIEKSPTMLKAVLSSSMTGGASEAAAPSPAPRKKMSLSDWSSRNKKKKIEAAQQAAQSSPLSVGNANTSTTEDGLIKSPEEERKLELPSDDTMGDADHGVYKVEGISTNNHSDDINGNIAEQVNGQDTANPIDAVVPPPQKAEDLATATVPNTTSSEAMVVSST